MTRYVLAIDNGSQSTKVHVVDEVGTVHTSAQCRLAPTVQTPDGRVVHPDDDLWDSIVQACREVLERFSPGADVIEAVGLCTIRFCRAYLSASGTLAEPVLSWMDERVSRAFKDSPEIAYVTTSSGYITHRFTGCFRDTAANYAGMWPIDLHTARWSDHVSAYKATGMPREKLFELVDPGELLGHVTDAAASATGLPAGIPVFATANDKAVEALGAGVDDGSVLLSLGTYIAAMTTGPEPTKSDPAYWVNFACEPGRYLYESNGIRRGMWSVSWVRDLVIPPDSPLPQGVIAEDVLNAEAAGVPPGCGGLHALLDFLAPTGQPYRRGAFLGFDGSQSRAHLYRSVLEGIALTMADNLDAMENALERRANHLVVTGGGAKSKLMMHILADVTNLPTRRAAVDDAAGLGSAMCALVGLGVHPDFPTARRLMSRAGAQFDPDPSGVAAYQHIRATHRKVYRYTDPMFRDQFA